MKSLGCTVIFIDKRNETEIVGVLKSYVLKNMNSYSAFKSYIDKLIKRNLSIYEKIEYIGIEDIFRVDLGGELQMLGCSYIEDLDRKDVLKMTLDIDLNKSISKETVISLLFYNIEELFTISVLCRLTTDKNFKEILKMGKVNSFIESFIPHEMDSSSFELIGVENFYNMEEFDLTKPFMILYNSGVTKKELQEMKMLDVEKEAAFNEALSW